MMKLKDAAIVVVAVLGLAGYAWYRIDVAQRQERLDAQKDWYLVCATPDREYLVKTPKKAYTKDGFIYIDGETFITAEPNSTCKPVEGDVVRQAIGKQVVSNQGK